MRQLNYNDDTFTSLPEDFAGHYRIPKGIKTIENNAFENCRYLKSIDIPEDVTSIGNGAFMGCENLEEITIPEGVNSIGNSAFAVCINLKEIKIPEDVTSIGYDAFMFCVNLEEITIPEGVTNIGDCAFAFCRNLKMITIPSTLTNVGENFLSNTSFSENDIRTIQTHIKNNITKPENKIFTHTTQEANKAESESESKDNDENKNFKYQGDKDIESYPIPGGCTRIGHRAFDGCSALMHIEIPSSVTEIGASAFMNCRHLTQIEIPSSVTEIGEQAFWGCSALTQIEIPSSVTKIGMQAFFGCSKLKRIAILGNSTSIDWPLFEDCTSLEKVVIKSSRYVLEKGLIYNNAKTELFECINTLCDTDVVIDPKVRIIHSRAFHNLENITSITLPRNLTIIEDDAFYFPDYDPEINFIVQTERMEQIELEYSHPFINLDNKCTLTVPIGTGYAYRHHPIWEKFKNINVASFNYGEESVDSDSEESR